MYPSRQERMPGVTTMKGVEIRVQNVLTVSMQLLFLSHTGSRSGESVARERERERESSRSTRTHLCSRHHCSGAE